ncbi:MULTISPECIES: alpha/beta hydrolase-fold protein [unclassified Pseudoalteromonas]|uniref:alpha/beta hydrolase-fold protein n=1 Tax=unclassified Pseudoalteromonas TaxID=194690 RepID=UPI0005A85ACF|nr:MULTISPECIES: alpha/beta hydrolase-fold protein [unclassified Pseudoalteromonas]
MIRTISFILSTFFILLSQSTLATHFNLGERVKINSKVLSEQRELQVLLPENYQANPTATYPVIYLLDGDYNFHAVSGMLDLMANKAQLIPDVILVGIADKGTDKYRQYMTPEGLTSPLKAEDKGKANEFLSFINKELKPYINKHYRTADNNILVGHSIAGLFVLNALVEQPDSFNNYISTSPSLWLNKQAFTKTANDKIANSNHKPVSLYLSLGDETRMNQYGFINILDELQPANINWKFTHYPDENHNSVGLISLRNSLKSIFKGWFIAEKMLRKKHTPNSIVSHYAKLVSELNINQAIPTPSIKSAIRYFYMNKKADELAPFMEQTIKSLPASEQAFIIMQASYVSHFNSPKAALALLKSLESKFETSIEYLKSIATTYEQLKDDKSAISYFEKALKLAKKQQVNQWQISIIDTKLLKLRD